MIQHAFSVFDTAAQRFLEPFWAPTIEFAIREFRRAVNTDGHQFQQFPEDYTLFHVGSFNQERGEMVPLGTPHNLGVAVTLITSSGNGVDMRAAMPGLTVEKPREESVAHD